jgi:type I restriction enzyme M protein
MSELGKTLWKIADELRGSMNADDFRDLVCLFALHELIYLHHLLCSLKIYQNHEK